VHDAPFDADLMSEESWFRRARNGISIDARRASRRRSAAT
jgi:hypothetical protein